MYLVFLNGNKIGETNLEFADPPMGVVFGKLHFNEDTYNYHWLVKYCQENSLLPAENIKDMEFICTPHLPRLLVMSNEGSEIEGVSQWISGSSTDGFEVEIVEIPYPFYKQEFLHHVQEYEQRYPSL